MKIFYCADTNNGEKVEVTLKIKPQDLIFGCKKCCKAFKSKQLFDQHLPNCGQVVTQKTATTPGSPAQPIAENGLWNMDLSQAIGDRPDTPGFQCDKCHKYFQVEANYKRHMSLHSGQKAKSNLTGTVAIAENIQKVSTKLIF